MAASGVFYISEGKREMLELDTLCGKFPLDPFWKGDGGGAGAGKEDLECVTFGGVRRRFLVGLEKLKGRAFWI